MIFIVFVVVRALDDYFCNNQHQDEPDGENYDCHLISYNMLLADAIPDSAFRCSRPTSIGFSGKLQYALQVPYFPPRCTGRLANAVHVVRAFCPSCKRLWRYPLYPLKSVS